MRHAFGVTWIPTPPSKVRLIIAKTSAYRTGLLFRTKSTTSIKVSTLPISLYRKRVNLWVVNMCAIEFWALVSIQLCLVTLTSYLWLATIGMEASTLRKLLMLVVSSSILILTLKAVSPVIGEALYLLITTSTELVTLTPYECQR